jgi:hypothetical protein
MSSFAMCQSCTNSAPNKSQHKKPCGIHGENVRAVMRFCGVSVQTLQECSRHHTATGKNFGITQPERLVKPRLVLLSHLFGQSHQPRQSCFNAAQLGSEFFLLHSSPERVWSHRTTSHPARASLSLLRCLPHHTMSVSRSCFNTAQLGREFFLLHSSPERVRSHHVTPSWKANWSLALP